MSDRFRTINCLVRKTADGLVPTVITYHRPPTNKQRDYNDGKVMVHTADAAREHLEGIASKYFFRGVQMSVADLRKALVDGRMPERHFESVVGAGAHFRT
jgi:hypothetical protein